LRKIAGQAAPDAARVRSSRAEAISHMLLASDIFIGGGALATHPPLAERIRRVFGRPMPALPSPVLAQSAPTDRAVDIGEPIPWSAPTPGVSAMAASDAGAGHAPAPASPPPVSAAPQANWIDDFLQIALPFDLTPATLAFLVRAGNEAERQTWHTLFDELQLQRRERLMAQVQALAPAAHQLGLERLLTRCSALPMAERTTLRQQAHRIVLADGHLSLLELWRCLLIDHVLALARESTLRETHVRTLQSCAAAIHGVTTALAWQHRSGPGDAQALAQQWRSDVSTALGFAPPPPAGLTAPSLGALTAAMRQLAQLAPMRRPQLLKAWCAMVLADPLPASQPLWNSLRCICLLIDTPLPPEVQARYS
jgi:hypothetical protein